MRRSVVVALLLVVVLSACRVDATVRLAVRDDGSGTVSARFVLDAAAVRALEVGGAEVEDAVRLGDLQTAGWTSAWRHRKGGGAVLTLRKGFARAQDAGAVVAELNGPDGPLRHVRAARDASTFTSDWSLSGVADRRAVDTGIAADPDLVGRLTGQGVDVAALDQRIAAEVQAGLRLRVVADLPHAPARAYPLPAGRRVVLHATSSATATGRLVLLGLGVAIAVAALTLLVVGEVRHRHRRRGRERRAPARPRQI